MISAQANGTTVAIAADELKEGTVVATGVIETTVAAAPAGGGNPLLPQGRGRGGFFGGGNRGGGNRGGGGRGQ